MSNIPSRWEPYTIEKPPMDEKTPSGIKQTSQTSSGPVRPEGKSDSRAHVPSSKPKIQAPGVAIVPTMRSSRRGVGKILRAGALLAGLGAVGYNAVHMPDEIPAQVIRRGKDFGGEWGLERGKDMQWFCVEKELVADECYLFGTRLAHANDSADPFDDSSISYNGFGSMLATFRSSYEGEEKQTEDLICVGYSRSQIAEIVSPTFTCSGVEYELEYDREAVGQTAARFVKVED